jgi:hypothetical protein
VFDADDEVIFSSESGWECTLIETPTRQQLKAVFFEDSRGVTHLAFQRFLRDGRPMKDKKTLHLSQREVQVLKDFLSKIEVVELVGDSGVRFTAEAAQQLLEGQSLPLSLLTERRDEIIEFLRSEVSAPEVTALARRRDKLAEFREMLDQDLDEPTWQAWLESEPWILGFGAAPQFLHRIGDSLETVVKGFDPVAGGSRSDGLLRTAGRLSSLVFVEIKRPDADLLQEKAYRSDAWLPGRDVVGGVAQLHNAVDSAVKTFGQRYRVEQDGYETDIVIELCRPRSVLVVGQLASLFDADGRPHRRRFRCFESYRRSLAEPEVITFDELLERAAAAVELAER